MGFILLYLTQNWNKNKNWGLTMDLYVSLSLSFF